MTFPSPHRMDALDDPQPVLALIRSAFAYMEGRIDPPSSLHSLTAADITTQAIDQEVWLIGTTPMACMFLTRKPGALYIGKLATDQARRGQGLARQLVTQAALRAAALNLPTLELQSRVELVENHAAFRAMGFACVAETRHLGYDRTTSLTFRRDL